MTLIRRNNRFLRKVSFDVSSTNMNFAHQCSHDLDYHESTVRWSNFHAFRFVEIGKTKLMYNMILITYKIMIEIN